MGQDNFGQDGTNRKVLGDTAPADAAQEQVVTHELAADEAPDAEAAPDSIQPETGAAIRTFDPSEYSSLVVRTIDGLRVAIAGLPADMPVEIEGVVLDAMSVGELRALNRLPDSLRIIIPYRLLPESRVHVQGAEEGERGLQ